MARIEVFEHANIPPEEFDYDGKSIVLNDDLLGYEIRFCYKDSLLRRCKRSLDNPELTPDELTAYFKQAKRFSRMTLNEFADLRGENTYVTPYQKLGSTARQFISECAGPGVTKDETAPIVGQFPLYPGQSKPQRVHFVVGPYAQFFILAIDRDHSVKPGAAHGVQVIP